MEVTFQGQLFEVDGVCDANAVNFYVDAAFYQARFFYDYQGTTTGMHGWVNVPGAGAETFSATRQ